MGSIQSDAFTPEPTTDSVAVLPHADETTTRHLSGREREVLTHFAQGRSTKDVARILEISPRTIETYSALILQKLRARNRIHAVAIAFRAGILTELDRGASR